MKQSMGKIWADRVKIVLITALFASIGNWIYTWRLPTLDTIYPWQTWYGLALMVLIVWVSCLLHDLVAMIPKMVKIPVILYVATLTTILSVPSIGGGFATTLSTEFAKMNTLPLCTPILAYAGVSVGKELDTFKKQGIAIVVTGLITFIGTYVGSAFISNIVLKLTGVV